MAEYKLGNFTFQSEKEYELAKKELQVIGAISKKYDLNNPKVAKQLLELENSAGDRFQTAVGKAYIRKLENVAGIVKPIVVQTDKLFWEEKLVHILKYFLLSSFFLFFAVIGFFKAKIGTFSLGSSGWWLYSMQIPFLLSLTTLVFFIVGMVKKHYKKRFAGYMTHFIQLLIYACGGICLWGWIKEFKPSKLMDMLYDEERITRGIYINIVEFLMESIDGEMADQLLYYYMFVFVICVIPFHKIIFSIIRGLMEKLLPKAWREGKCAYILETQKESKGELRKLRLIFLLAFLIIATVNMIYIYAKWTDRSLYEAAEKMQVEESIVPTVSPDYEEWEAQQKAVWKEYYQGEEKESPKDILIFAPAGNEIAFQELLQLLEYDKTATDVENAWGLGYYDEWDLYYDCTLNGYPGTLKLLCADIPVFEWHTNSYDNILKIHEVVAKNYPAVEEWSNEDSWYYVVDGTYTMIFQTYGKNAEYYIQIYREPEWDF